MIDLSEIIILDNIEKMLEDAYEYNDQQGNIYKEVFIGTVMDFAPSKKYWTLWAHSNVTRDQMEKDAEFFEELNRELDKRGLYLTSGEGDPCDLYIGKVVKHAE